MAKTQEKSSIGLFLTSRKKSDVPKRGVSLPKVDYKAILSASESREAFRKQRDELQYPLIKARLEQLGMTSDKWEAYWKQKESAFKEYFKAVVLRPRPITRADLPPKILCREVLKRECQREVCVDQPLPFDVDEFWIESDGNTNEASGPHFSGNHADIWARVSGSSYYSGLNYHRRTKESYGAIAFRAGTVLVETAKVRQVGVTFSQSAPSQGDASSLMLDGEYFLTVPNSVADGSLTSTFQVSIEPPGGSLTRYVPDSGLSVVYNDPPEEDYDTGSPYVGGGYYPAVPPTRSIDLYETFPAGTYFLIEMRLSYWIYSRGQDSFSIVSYNFDAQPYINLEACSWQWPS